MCLHGMGWSAGWLAGWLVRARENSSCLLLRANTPWKDTQGCRRMPKLKTDMAAESAAKEDARPEPDTFFTGIRSVTLMLPALGTG